MLFPVIALIALGLAFAADKTEFGRDAGAFTVLRGKIRPPACGELINRFGTPLQWQ
jgi:hypothetical protein